LEASGNGRQSKTILVVDDADGVRGMVCAVLSRHGYRCLTAADGAEALRVIETEAGGLSLVLTDVVMPNMTGAELARRLVYLRPGLRILFMSGYSDDSKVRQLSIPSLYLPKPFTATALAETVRDMLERPWPGLPAPTCQPALRES
jgi:CheY-like chemotaxis protein